jgi:hypothetical protein
LSFNSHLKKFSVVHSDRPNHAFQNPHCIPSVFICLAPNPAEHHLSTILATGRGRRLGDCQLHLPANSSTCKRFTVSMSALAYRADYNNRPSNSIYFMPAIARTSDRLHYEHVSILFLQAQRETDPHFSASGVEHAQHKPGTVPLSLRINLGIDGAPIASCTHTHPSPLANLSLLFTSLS